MSEDAPAKSHAGRWIVGVVLTVLLYLGSAHPVQCLNYKIATACASSTSLPAWYDPVQRDLDIFYMPAQLVWNQTVLRKIQPRWKVFCQKIIYEW